MHFISTLYENNLFIIHKNYSGLQGLSKLRYLNLSENHLIGNHIFESLSKLTSLEAIHIEGSTMSGTTLRNTGTQITHT